MKRKTLVLLTIISFLLLATLGTSVALFSVLKNGSGLVSIRSGDINFKYTEVSGIGNGINLDISDVISDSEGKVLDNYFDFKINSNLVHNDMIYEVSVEAINNSIPLEGVKIYLTEVNGNTEKDIMSNYNGLGKVKTISDYNDFVFYQERILKNTKNYEKNFRVRIWISEDVDIFSNSYMNKSGGFRINVKARSNYTMVNSTIPIPVITGGLGTTWTTESQTISLALTNPVLGGVLGYEYYVTDNQEDIPNDLTIATGTTDNLYYVTIIGKNYVYYRIVTSDNTKSDWSSPEVVYFDNNTYTITYNLNGGTQGENPITSYNVETSTFSLPTPTKAGYIFNGWYEDSNFNGNLTTQIDKGSRGNKEYYAKWNELIALIPTMTSNTSPSGIASGSSLASSYYQHYYAFCNGTCISGATSAWIPAINDNSPYIQYQFNTARIVVKAKVYLSRTLVNQGQSPTYSIKASNDGTNWITLLSNQTGTLNEVTIDIPNNTSYSYYRLQFNQSINQSALVGTWRVYKLQFYGY